MSDQFRWIKIAEGLGEICFASNGIAEVAAEGKTICVARYQEQLFAFAQKCPHAGGFFIEGYVDALGQVVCPLHRYKFSLRNGRNVSGEGYYLRHWPVEVWAEGIFVGFERNRLFGGFEEEGN